MDPHCPYHTLLEHVNNLDAVYLDIPTDILPLFPQASGEELPAAAMVYLIEELARRTGQSVTTPGGRNRFGRHSFRSTGAVLLSTIGIEVTKLTMLGRWSCGVVIHYTRLAPLKSLAADFRRAIIDRPSSSSTAAPKTAAHW